VAATDGSATAEEAVRRAFALAESHSADTAARDYDPVTAILDVARAEKADLILVGNRGMRGPKPVLSSVTDVIAQTSGCDVLIVNTT
jgi:nucleotide-binding universal stress UspA family protein